MRASSSLVRLQQDGLDRTRRLRSYMSRELYSGPSWSQTSPLSTIDPGIAFVTVELDNLWSGLARSFYLSTAFGARDKTGHRIRLANVPRAASIEDALAHAIQRCNPKRFANHSGGSWSWQDEPLWWRPRSLLDSLDQIGAANHQQVSGALSASPTVFQHLHSFRNFYAHRGHGTRGPLERSMRSLNLPTTHSATRALAFPLPVVRGMRPQPLILDWLDDIHDTIELLV